MNLFSLILGSFWIVLANKKIPPCFSFEQIFISPETSSLLVSWLFEFAVSILSSHIPPDNMLIMFIHILFYVIMYAAPRIYSATSPALSWPSPTRPCLFKHCSWRMASVPLEELWTQRWCRPSTVSSMWLTTLRRWDWQGAPFQSMLTYCYPAFSTMFTCLMTYILSCTLNIHCCQHFEDDLLWTLLHNIWKVSYLKGCRKQSWLKFHYKFISLVTGRR